MEQKPGHRFVHCIENNIASFGKDFDKTLEYCLENDKDTLLNVKECMGSRFGNLFQHIMADRTPKHNYVPWITVNGEHNVTYENEILSSLINFIKKHYPDEEKKEEKLKFLS